MSEDRRPPDDPTNTDGVLGADKADQNSNSRNDKLPEKRIGDFDLLRELGRGGMGVVYEARQVSLNRRVALKVLPPGLGMTEIAIQRFEREARAAAKLHHTNIVPVHAIGEEEGCHYYAMELVEGEPLSRVLNDLRGQGSNPLLESVVNKTAADAPARGKEAAGSPTTSGPTSLSDSASSSREWFDTVARLLAEVADGLHYAHGRGVIHRDVKPANLMLSKDGRLCLTDFGLARVAQEPGMTVSGSFLGTPAYMSPEQIAAGRVQVDNRSDIYSLGAVLYEMLCLRRPFTGESRDEILNGIMTKDPRPPRRFNPRIPVDLETICQKAMEKDRDRRYQTAGEFANDLRQYLQRGLITARRAGPIRRGIKSVRRHPVASLAVVGAALLIVVGFWAWRASERGAELEVLNLLGESRYAMSQGDYGQALRTAEEALAVAPGRAEARMARARSLVYLRRGQEALEEALARLEENPDDWVAHAIVVVASRSGGFYAEKIEPHVEAVERLTPNTAESFILRAMLAETNRESLELLNRALELDPGNAEALIQRTVAHLGLKDYRAALADADRLVVARPRSTWGRTLRAICYMNLHNPQRALEEMERAIDADPADPTPYEIRAGLYSQLGEREKGLADLEYSIGTRPEGAWVHLQRAWELQAVGRNDEALSDIGRALELSPDDPRILNSVIRFHREQGDHDEVSRLIGVLESKLSMCGDPDTVAWIRRDLSNALLWLGNLEEALSQVDLAIEADPEDHESYIQRAEVMRHLEGESGVVEDCNRAAAIQLEDLDPLLNRAGSMAYQCNRPDLALRDFTRLTELTPNWPEPWFRRGLLHRNEGRLRESLADLDRAAELAPTWAVVHANRALVLGEMERFEDALQAYARFRELGGWDWPAVTHYRANWLYRLGRAEEALIAIDEAIARDPQEGILHRTRAFLLMYDGRTDEALLSIERAVEVEPRNALMFLDRAYFSAFGQPNCGVAMADVAQARKLAPENPQLDTYAAFVVFTNLTHKCPDQVDLESALRLAQRAVEFDSTEWFYQTTLGLGLYRVGYFEEAREALRRTRELPVRGFWDIKAIPWFTLAMVEWRLGNRAEARQHYDRGVMLVESTAPNSPLLLRAQDEAAALLGIEQ